MKQKVVLAWSGGKDSAMALHALLASPVSPRAAGYEVVSLLTTLSRQYRRISHHGVRVELLEQQAAALGIRVDKLYLPRTNCTIEQYEAVMEKAMLQYKRRNVLTVAFGDIFLQDLREYRQRNLARVGMKAIFPIWGRGTAELVRTFIALGFKAYLTCVDSQKLGEQFAGKPIDASLIRDLPDGVDPCGENGEYHSFVYDGPIFRQPVEVRTGQVVLRDTRYFADLLPASRRAPRRRVVTGEI